MFGTIDVRWRRLRLPLAVCTAAALAGGAAAAAAWWHENRAAERMNAAEARLAEARGRHLALAEEQRTRRRFGPLYRRLAANGRIGEERIERRAEAVRRAGAAVLSARHRTGASHVVRRTGPVEVRAADTSIDLEMRHEADLPVFLAALDREAPGLFTVPGCRLLRTDETGTPFASVGASCRIRWQSVVLTGVEPGWTPPAGADRGDEAEHEAGDDGGVGGGDQAGNGAGAGPRGWPRDLSDPPREAFGRLFTTVAQRAEIESATAARIAAKQAAEVPKETPLRSGPPPRATRWVRVGGVVVRTGRSVYAWIDGRRVAVDGPHPVEGWRPEEATPAEVETPGVRLGAGRRSIVVRPGQRFDPRTGAVIDPVHRPAGRFERDRFLRESSRAPLTDPPVLEQN